MTKVQKITIEKLINNFNYDEVYSYLKNSRIYFDDITFNYYITDIKAQLKYEWQRLMSQTNLKERNYRNYILRKNTFDGDMYLTMDYSIASGTSRFIKIEEDEQ